MRKLSILLALVGMASSITLSAQFQHFNSMNYQGVARNASGDPVPNQNVSVRFQIYYGLSNAYFETQSLTTDAFGVFTARIGTGTPAGGVFPSFDAIDWWAGNFSSIQVFIDITGGTNYVFAGNSALNCVPFAAMAEQSFALVDSVVYSNTGAVIMKPTARMGLGTTSPQNILDVEGGAAIGATYSGTNTAPANGLIVEGNVGIGLNNPTSKLEVVGAVRIADGTQGAGKVLTSNATGNATWSTVVSSGTYTPTLSGASGFTSVVAMTCEYSRVGALVTVLCTTGSSAHIFAAGTNTVNLSVPAALPVATVSFLPGVNGTFASDHYRNGTQTSLGLVSYNNATVVNLKMNGSAAGAASAYCDFTYKTSAP